jgi:hypothetical protein
MEQNDKLKLCISYSHLDENQINELIKHIAPLKSNASIEEWYDRKIVAGKEFQDTIDNNLENADIIFLCISANFLFSKECMTEKRKALDLRKRKGISVVPIILSACGWLDDKDISPLLALPTDGKPISIFPDSDSAWHDVYNGLKILIGEEIKIRQLKITDQFTSFLENTELFAKAHPQRKEVFLDDIFVYPELEIYNDLREYEKKDSSEKLINEFSEYSKIVIAGEDQSGKTTLCKKYFIELRIKNFVPIYVSDKLNQFEGLIENRITKAFKEQYEGVLFEEINKKRIVPIIDDFHFAKKKEKHIRDLTSFSHQIIIVDDIFSLNFRDENLLKSFNQFKIRQFSPSLRNCLIEKWIHLNDNISTAGCRDIEIYKGIDNATELVDTSLGKVLSSGIMPAYPFFILSIISTYETFEKPLDQEITSQGYCYQALIYLYLRKQGVKNDDVDTYINFLTEFAFYFYKEKKKELSIDEFNAFMTVYLNTFNFPIKKEILLNNLQNTKIIHIDNFNNYSFNYPYLYYFFVAKYLAEHRINNLEIIESIVNNLHNNENAYIAIFISHHSKNVYILEEIIRNALGLFNKYESATLTKDELSFFDDNIDNIVKAVLPLKNSSPEKVRAERLKNQDLIEQINENDDKQRNADIKKKEEDEDVLAKELRRSVKTVEVMGVIIKNRAGSLEKGKLENVFVEAMKVHLRILTSFFELIKNEKQQSEIVDFIKTRMDAIIKDKTKKPSQEQLERMSKRIFWNVNFSVVFGFINKIIHSLGSDKLQTIIDKECNNINTPASFLVKHGILMWYSKNLQIDNIADRIDEDDFSETAKRIMKFMIVNHCSLHTIGYKEIQKIEHRIKIPSQKLIIASSKK